jgi:hypothetical protein
MVQGIPNKTLPSSPVAIQLSRIHSSQVVRQLAAKEGAGVATGGRTGPGRREGLGAAVGKGVTDGTSVLSLVGELLGISEG